METTWHSSSYWFHILSYKRAKTGTERVHRNKNSKASESNGKWLSVHLYMSVCLTACEPALLSYTLTQFVSHFLLLPAHINFQSFSLCSYHPSSGLMRELIETGSAQPRSHINKKLTCLMQYILSETSHPNSRNTVMYVASYGAFTVM